MENSQRRLHPLVATAAGAVTVASLVAVAAITGVLPRASGNNADNTAAMQQDAAQAQQQQLQQQQEQQLQQQRLAQARQAERYEPAQRAPARRYEPAPQQRVASTCSTCGTVESIVPMHTEGQATGIGAVGGAVAGGLLGNQFGRGNGRTAMTVLGALGGGLAGNTVEKNVRSTTAYQVHVRMDTGQTRTFTYRSAPGWQPGSRVRLENGALASIS